MSADSDLAASIEAVCARAPTGAQIDRLHRFLDLLERWNRAYNLSAIRRRQDMVPGHLLDSLSVEPYLHGPRILDVGTGAGLPGVPLAVLRPDLSFVLLDSSAKRVRFLREVRRVLALAQVEVVQARVQEYRPRIRFDTVLSRAFSSLRDFVDNAGRLAGTSGRLLAMKGPAYAAEDTSLPAGYRLQEVRQLTVPGLRAGRVLIAVERTR